MYGGAHISEEDIGAYKGAVVAVVLYNTISLAGPSIESCSCVDFYLFLHMPADTTEGVVKHSFGCNHQSTCMSQLQPLCLDTLILIHYPGGMKARVGPEQLIEPHRILAPTRDSNQGPPRPQYRVVTTILPLHTGAHVWWSTYAWMGTHAWMGTYTYIDGHINMCSFTHCTFI